MNAICNWIRCKMKQTEGEKLELTRLLLQSSDLNRVVKESKTIKSRVLEVEIVMGNVSLCN
jgi:hypothetical protein